ncbi:MAG: transglutaminase-like domain-containing protein [Gemmataceae bacterium]|nr:transglutaminase-like domain-containing protein [Gemmataceae bacterium]
MDLDTILTHLAEDPAAPLDVAELALRLAADEYPDLDVEAYLSELDGMAREARAYIGGDLDAQVNGLCRYLFHEMGFRGNTQNYYDARNSYLNEVLDLRRGIPITLSIVAIAVGARAGLEVVGVGLPGHFVAKAVNNGDEAIFDPFHGGRRLTLEECEQLVEQVTKQPIQVGALHLAPLPVGLIAQRMLINLKGIYLKAEDYPRALRILGRLRQLAPRDVVQRRDLGATLLQAGQPGPAIDHLEAYLNALSDGPDVVAVQELLDRAKSEVARWN